MKKLILFAALLIPVLSFAQAPNKTPSSFEQTGQMLNLANTNKNEVLDSISTSSSASTVYLTTAQYSATTALPILFPVIGYGTIAFTVNVLKYSGTVTGSVALQGSIDGVQWGPVHTGAIVSSDTFQLANVAGAQGYAFSVDIKKFRFYRLCIICPSSTQGISFSGFYFLNKNYLYTNK